MVISVAWMMPFVSRFSGVVSYAINSLMQDLSETCHNDPLFHSLSSLGKHLLEVVP